MKSAQKKRIESKITRIVESVLSEQFNPDDLALQLVSDCDYDLDKVFDVFLQSCRELNYGTLAKYLGRFAADLSRNGWNVEDTKLYSAGY